MWNVAARLAFAFGFLLVACAADQPVAKSKKAKPATEQPGDDDDKDDGTTEEVPKVSFAWKACSGNFQAMSSCATAKVPLDWSAPDGKQIDLFAARLGSGKATTQLFMVQGGPGGSADALVDLAQMVTKARPDVDVILVEHRGVGHSSRLTCASSELPTVVDADEASACVADLKKEWGEGVKSFSTTNAARDLASAVASLRPEGGKAFVYGVSYGTFWVHRMLQVAPKVADGAILDSAIPAPGARFDEFDAQGDPVLRRLGELCKQSRVCTANLGADPFATMSRIITTFDGTRCATALGATRTWLRGQVFGMLQIAPLAALVPSFLFRVARCTSADQQAIVAATNALNPQTGVNPIAGQPEGDLGSGPLYNTVVFSELWATPAPTQSTLKTRLASLTLTTGAVALPSGSLEDWVLNMDRKRPVWPVYAKDDFAGKWATTDVPVLVLNGDLDVQTPIEGARQYQTKLTGAGKTFAFIPFANHGTIIQSTMRDGSEQACGLRIILDFLKSPAKPDTSCTTQTAAPNVDVDADSARFFYNATSGWGTTLAAPVSHGDGVLRDVADMESDTIRRLRDHLRIADRLRLVPKRPIGLGR